MSKPTINNQNYHTRVVAALALKYDFSKKYINLILKKERTPIFADRIIAEYNEMVKAVDNILTSPNL